jgi:transcriptional regulator with XRE-family HTH domain
MKAPAILSAARRRASISQHELGRRSGVEQSTISRIERGRMTPSVEVLDRLVRACGMDLVAVERPGKGLDTSLVDLRLEMTEDQRVRQASLEWEGLSRFREGSRLLEESSRSR